MSGTTDSSVVGGEAVAGFESSPEWLAAQAEAAEGSVYGSDDSPEAPVFGPALFEKDGQTLSTEPTDQTYKKRSPKSPKSPDERLKKLGATASIFWRSLSISITSPEREGETALQYLKRKAREGFPEDMGTKARHGVVDSLYDFMTRARCEVVWVKIQSASNFFEHALPADFIDPTQIKLAEAVADYELSKDVSAWLNAASELLADLVDYEPLCPSCGLRELRLRPNKEYFDLCFDCEDKKRVKEGGPSIRKPKPTQSKPRSKPAQTPKELVGVTDIEALALHFKDGSLPEGFDTGSKGGGSKKGKRQKSRENGFGQGEGRGERKERRGGRSNYERHGGREFEG